MNQIFLIKLDIGSWAAGCSRQCNLHGLVCDKPTNLNFGVEAWKVILAPPSPFSALTSSQCGMLVTPFTIFPTHFLSRYNWNLAVNFIYNVRKSSRWVNDKDCIYHHPHSIQFFHIYFICSNITYCLTINFIWKMMYFIYLWCC